MHIVAILLNFIDFIIVCLCADYLNASQTRSLWLKLRCPHAESTHWTVRASFIQPFLLRHTTSLGIFVNSGIGRTPLKTMKGFSFHPSAIAARMTVKRPLSCPVVRTDTDRSPTRATVGSPGVTSQSGVSSMFPMADKGYYAPASAS